MYTKFDILNKTKFKMKKYKLTNEEIVIAGRKLRRIEALKDFRDVKAGEKGGFVESESNLSHEGECWVYNNAAVCGNAEVCSNARIRDYAIICGNAVICDDAIVCGDAILGNYTVVYGDTIV